jgi:TolB-like protein/DNA-binding winged helix-turn-helix (wHTH) protein/Flp pilus assembly protein TadD
MHEPPSGLLQFGAFQFDPSTLELRERGAVCRLQPQPAKVLRQLLAEAGELVTREELRVAIWGTETFVDFDQGLNFCIKRIRAVLHDDSDRPVYIETVPRRGYRFIAPVEAQPPVVSAPTPAPAAESGPPVEPARSFEWRGTLIGAALAVVVCASLAVLVAVRQRTSHAPAAGKHIVAVLPFENLDRDSGEDYFSQGFTEETVTHLSRIDPEAIAVIARTTIQRYALSRKTPDEIGRATGATHVVEGRVRRENGRVRVTAQLTETGGQTNVWAGSYDRDLRDVLIVQQDIALAIARAIGSTLSARRLPPPRQVNADAYQLYLKGRFFWNHRRPESLAKARAYFAEALARDPEFARAYAGLGDVEFSAIGTGAPGALAMAQKALSLDPTLGEAHTTAGHAAMHAFDWPAAGASLERAIQLDPAYTPARYFYAEYLVANGRFDAAIAEARRAIDLEPANSIANHALGTIYYYARRYEEAERQFRAALELDPQHHWSHSRLGQVYEQQARYADAIREFAAGGFTYGRARASARAGDPREARSLVRNPDVSTSPYELALLLAGLGDVQAALDALERATTLPSYDTVYLAVDPKLDPLRISPRFATLLERVRLPQLAAEIARLSSRR